MGLAPWICPVRLPPRCEEHNSSMHSSYQVGANFPGGRTEEGSFVRRGVLRVQCEVYNVSHRARCIRHL